MEHALAELQNAEEDLGRYGPSLAGKKPMTCSSTGGKTCRRWVARRRVILCELLQQVANTDVYLAIRTILLSSTKSGKVKSS